MDPADALKASSTPAGVNDATTVNHSLVSASSEHCPSCGSAIAADQRYCLHCGQRCGEPRLPFMNATTFMDTMNRPPAQAQASSPPPKQRRRLSPNAALIAGVGTLLLAMGVGVLIGHSGNQSGTTSAAAPQVITVHSGGGAETETPETTSKGNAAGKGGKANKKASASAKKKAETGQGAEEVLKPSAGVKLPPATAKPGSKCESGAAGCKGGEFTGEFFGE
jgi:hypothetical protein